jgi:hypothetical protein
MRRLVDKGEDAAGMERLTELVSAAEPFRPNPFAKRHMLRRLKRKSSGQRPLLKAWVSPIGLMFIVGSAIAGAGWWQARKNLDHPATTAGPPAIPSPPAAPAAAAPPAPAAPSPAELPPSVAGPHVPTEATPSDNVARESVGPPPKAPTAKRRGATARETTAARAAATTSDDPIPLSPPAQDGEDPTPVVRAIRALRSERNPAQAEQLLQQYLRTNPDGALAEDARALLIETASALRSPSAADRATRYLELYPNGRYRATARRVLSRRP